MKQRRFTTRILTVLAVSIGLLLTAGATAQAAPTPVFTFYTHAGTPLTPAPVDIPASGTNPSGKKIASPAGGFVLKYTPTAPHMVVTEVVFTSSTAKLTCPVVVDPYGNPVEIRGQYSLNCGTDPIPEGAYTLSYTTNTGGEALPSPYYFYAAGTKAEIQVEPLVVNQGESFTVQGKNFFPGTAVEISIPGILSAPVTVPVKDPEGTFTIDIPVGAQTPQNTYTVTARDTSTIRSSVEPAKAIVVPVSKQLNLQVAEISKNGFKGTLSGQKFPTSLKTIKLYTRIDNKFIPLNPASVELTNGDFPATDISINASLKPDTEYKVYAFDPSVDPQVTPQAVLSTSTAVFFKEREVPVPTPQPDPAPQPQPVPVPEPEPAPMPAPQPLPDVNPTPPLDLTPAAPPASPYRETATIPEEPPYAAPSPVLLEHLGRSGIERVSTITEIPLKNQKVPSLNASNESAEKKAADDGLSAPSTSDAKSGSSNGQSQALGGGLQTATNQNLIDWWWLLLVGAGMLILGLLFGSFIARKRNNETEKAQ